ncbi:hypothetical protein OG612_45450 (plasmid) [Streptomyces sp. NBC_01527]|uniref:hypothetical protein n=1 Tax=Streptomyces sp. NBC_01527 TaxID=2903894 RepID=UPI002F91091F
MPNAQLARRMHDDLDRQLSAAPAELPDRILAFDLVAPALREVGAAMPTDRPEPADLESAASRALSLDDLDAIQLFNPALAPNAVLDALQQLADGADLIDWDAIVDPYGLVLEPLA